MDDGTVTPWTYKGAMSKLDVLVVHWLELQGNSGPYINPTLDHIRNIPAVSSVDVFNLGPYTDGNNAPGLAMMQEYGVILWMNNWGQYSAWWDNIKEEFGDDLADYMDTTGGGVITTMATYDLGGGTNWVWTLLGRYMDEDYGSFERTGYPFGDGNLGTVYLPAHPVMDGVTDMTSSLIHSGDYPMTAGAVKLADWTDGNTALGCKEVPTGGRSVNMGWGSYNPGNDQGDIARWWNNAVMWAYGGEIVLPPIDPVTYTYGDNGVYNVDLQIIDDDMGWTWTIGGGDLQPTPTADATISHNYFPIEVFNTDPIIPRDIRAYAEVDLSIRVSGTKNTDVTMTLYENGEIYDKDMVYGQASVTRDPGSPDIGVIGNVELEMTKDHVYEIVVECFGGTGGNPTWIFDMHFPDGKFKELKHTFNDEHGWTWTITDSMLKGALVGHDIILETHADDLGSDDLAFIYNYGDRTPHGVHLYANVEQGTAVEGVTEDAELMFTQLGANADPWFEYDLNDDRSPEVNQIHVTDSISHVFMDPYYYYVTVVVTDDDVDEPYASTQLHTGSGCDMAYVEIDLR
jgi:hypothetical protein